MIPCWHFSMSPPAACSSFRMMFSTSSPTYPASVRVVDGERDGEELGERLGQQRLAGAGRPDQQDVRLGELDLVAAAALLLDFDPLVVVVDRDRQLLLGLFLADHVLVEKLLDFLRNRQGRAGPATRLEPVVVG